MYGNAEFNKFNINMWKEDGFFYFLLSVQDNIRTNLPSNWNMIFEVSLGMGCWVPFF